MPLILMGVVEPRSVGNDRVLRVTGGGRMRVIVTGGAGFVGGLLARRLLAGPVEVGGRPGGGGEVGRGRPGGGARGRRGSLDGTRAFLEHARRQGEPPLLVFSSSVAVFGPEPEPGPAGVVG